jgi:hypothetical protein
MLLSLWLGISRQHSRRASRADIAADPDVSGSSPLSLYLITFHRAVSVDVSRDALSCALALIALRSTHLLHAALPVPGRDLGFRAEDSRYSVSYQRCEHRLALGSARFFRSRHALHARAVMRCGRGAVPESSTLL